MSRFVRCETSRLLRRLGGHPDGVGADEAGVEIPPRSARVPAGNPDGGQWTDAAWVRVAGGAEDEETSRRSIIENPMAELRQTAFDNNIRALRRLDPTNPQLSYASTPDYVPTQSQVDALHDEVEEAQTRTAAKIASGHAFEKHASEIGASSRFAFAETARQIISNPFNQVRDLPRGRTGFYDAVKNIVVFVDPASRDGGTMFKATQKYFSDQEGF